MLGTDSLCHSAWALSLGLLLGGIFQDDAARIRSQHFADINKKDHSTCYAHVCCLPSNCHGWPSVIRLEEILHSIRITMRNIHILSICDFLFWVSFAVWRTMPQCPFSPVLIYLYPGMLLKSMWLMSVISVCQLIMAWFTEVIQKRGSLSSKELLWCFCVAWQPNAPLIQPSWYV